MYSPVAVLVVQCLKDMVHMGGSKAKPDPASSKRCVSTCECV